MSDSSLLDDPVILESINKASDELLRRSQNKETPLEQRLESLERKVDFLLDIIRKNRLQVS
jgi:hypothetical protein